MGRGRENGQDTFVFDGDTVAKECMNAKCKRWHVPVVSTLGDGMNLRCSQCGGWMRLISVADARRLEQSLLIDNESFDAYDEPRSLEELVGGLQRQQQPQPAQQNILQAAEPDDTFECEADVKGCPVAGGATVNVPIEMWDRWVFLANKMDTEWLAYLKGEEVEPGVFNITEMYFPAQHMEPATCMAVDGERQQEGTIGSVHSHVAMSAFFSGEDEKHFNHPVELVINRKGDVDCRVRRRLDCGRWQRVVGKVMLSGCQEQLDQLAELKAKKVERGGRGQGYMWQRPERPEGMAVAVTQQQQAAKEAKSGD